MMDELEPSTASTQASKPLLPGPDPVRRVRTHALTLCCAESVAPVVAEVGRALAGLGFRTEIVTGSDARAAILDRDRTHDSPVIHVVCVQGELEDTVVGPLRQALATHGGPDEHLFVAVLDLSLPLSMVGQIRRFAEALDRMPGTSRPDPAQERRQWREHSGSRAIDGKSTSTYRTVERDQVRRRSARTTPIRTSGTPARIEPTRKYRAITGPVPVVAEGPSAVATERGDPPKKNRRRVRIPQPGTRAATEAKTDSATTPVQFGAAIAPESPRGGRALKVVLAAFLLAGLGYASYRLGAYDSLLPSDLRANETEQSGPASTRVVRADVTAPSQPEHSPIPSAAAEPNVAGSSSAGEDAPSTHLDIGLAEPERGTAKTPSSALDAPVATASGPEDPPVSKLPPSPVPPSPDTISPTPSGRILAPPSNPQTEAALADAILRRDVKISNTYYVASPGAASTRWIGARRACRELTIDDVGDWRLPHRRELQLLGAIGMLTRGSFWSRTVDADDESFAFVYERNARRLSSWEKTELANVVCVRKRS